jgi:hypothetical protein
MINSIITFSVITLDGFHSTFCLAFLSIILKLILLSFQNLPSPFSALFPNMVEFNLHGSSDLLQVSYNKFILLLLLMFSSTVEAAKSDLIRDRQKLIT